MTITNNTGALITLISVDISNPDGDNLVSITAGSQEIWNGSDSGTTKSFSSWSGSSSDREITASGGTLNMVFTFQNPVTDVTATSFDFNFDNGCTLSATYTP